MITPTLAHAIAEAIESRLIDVHVALPCKVQSYDAATQTADLIPQIKRPLSNLTTGEKEHESLPVLPSVPVAFPRAGDWCLSYPIATGDFVLVIFADYSLDQWRAKGSETAPGDIGKATLAGAVAIPIGIYPTAQAHTLGGADMVLGKQDGCQVRVKSAGTVDVTSSGAETAADFVAMAAKTKAALDDILGIFSAGTPAKNDGGAALQTAWKLAAGSVDTDVASTNLKADG